VRTWLGLLGPNASTTIIDTSLYGKWYCRCVGRKVLCKLLFYTIAKHLDAGTTPSNFTTTTSYLKIYEGPQVMTVLG
jgi:hypothetical protein